MKIEQNFCVSAAEVQVQSEDLYRADGSPTRTKQILEILNTVFTIVFTVELLLNFLSQNLRDFLTNAWSLFDTGVVLMSLIVLGPLDFPISILRALRVVRLFGRLESSKKILAALSVSLLPMCNAFFIMLIVAMICARPSPLRAWACARPSRGTPLSARPYSPPSAALRPAERFLQRRPARPHRHTGTSLAAGPLQTGHIPHNRAASNRPRAGMRGRGPPYHGRRGRTSTPPRDVGPSRSRAPPRGARRLAPPRGSSRGPLARGPRPAPREPRRGPAADSIMGVTLFREAAPASFGNFVRGLSVMFRLTAGDTWVDGLDEFDENGGPNYDASFFVYSYIVIVVWILLQVSVAVLLVSSPTHPLLSGGAPEAGSTWAAYLVVSSSRYPPQGPLFRGGGDTERVVTPLRIVVCGQGSFFSA